MFFTADLYSLNLPLMFRHLWRKQLPKNIAAQNNQLKNFFQPRGYPTIWIFDMNLNSEGTQYEINALGNLGYPSGSQPGQEDKKFIANADQILAKRQ